MKMRKLRKVPAWIIDFADKNIAPIADRYNTNNVPLLVICENKKEKIEFIYILN